MIKVLNIDLLEYVKNLELNSYTIVHCISNDWALGKGIAKTLDDRFSIKKNRVFDSRVGGCVLLNCNGVSIANLVTKDKYYMKPSYDTLFECIDNLDKTVAKSQILVMPKIACGLDKLDWAIVYNRLQLLDYNIVVCYI